MSRKPTTPPGWFPDQRDPSIVRFWDGREWTVHTAPAHAPAPTAPLGDVVPPKGPGPWKRLRLRTKVLAVVAALLVAGLLMPDTDPDPTAGPEDVAPTRSGDASDGVRSDETEASEESSAADESSEVAEPEIIMPMVRSKPIGEARKGLRKAGLIVEVVRRPSWEPAGTVLKQGVKKGTTMTAGQAVTLVVAAPMPRVPGVAGRGSEAARAALNAAGFRVAVSLKEMTSGPNNVVLGQSPPATAQAAPGTVVNLVVSKVVAPIKPLVSNCTPGYKPCLPPAPDYDCAGGSGNGPAYANGPIYVTGPDPYGLDADGDGVACAF